jgi:glycerol-3-phosphate dehydrogenase subunit B
MPRHDVVVIGAGLAGLTAACELAQSGARVALIAQGMAATHWMHGGLDVAAPPGARTSREGLRTLAASDGHPYALLADDVEPALASLLHRLASAGLPYRGGLDTPLSAMPTPVGGRRPAAILPVGQAAAASPWGEDERLLVVGFERFKDFWAPYMARNLRLLWRGDGPADVESEVVELPATAALNNLSPVTLGRAFDDPEWSARAVRTLAAIPRRGGSWRVALPAVLGVRRYAEVHAAVEEALGHPVFEVAGMPPSLPGVRLFEALRADVVRRGGRVLIGSPVVRVERDGRNVVAVHTEAASRTQRLAADRFVLATGGLAGGGLRAEPDGQIREVVFGLAVDAPPHDRWFDLEVGPHPLEMAGIRMDADLRPLDGAGEPALDNVSIAGSLLAGMRYLSERCGHGVAIASGWRAARHRAGAARREAMEASA